MHPRTIVEFVNDTLSGVTQYYRTVGNVWDSLYAKHQWRESSIPLDRAALRSTQCMMNTSINASKGKVPSKGKAKQEMVKVASPIGEHLVTNSGNQAVAHKDTTVESIIQGDSQADVQSVAQPATLILNALVQ